MAGILSLGTTMRAPKKKKVESKSKKHSSGLFSFLESSPDIIEEIEEGNISKYKIEEVKHNAKKYSEIKLCTGFSACF